MDNQYDPQVPCDDNVPVFRSASDRTLRVLLLACARSRYTAVVIIAFSISYAFHVVEQRTDEKIQQQADLTHCVIVDTVYQQRLLGDTNRVNLKAVLDGCEEKVFDNDESRPR